jgi:hypothetical protein
MLCSVRGEIPPPLANPSSYHFETAAAGTWPAHRYVLRDVDNELVRLQVVEKDTCGHFCPRSHSPAERQLSSLRSTRGRVVSATLSGGRGREIVDCICGDNGVIRLGTRIECRYAR